MAYVCQWWELPPMQTLQCMGPGNPGPKRAALKYFSVQKVACFVGLNFFVIFFGECSTDPLTLMTRI